MKISTVRITNFRGFADETINLGDYACLVGPNGGGKSTVLNALNVFFRSASNVSSELSSLDEEDFHHKNTREPAIIQVTFTDLNESAKREFSHYVRHDRLVISAKAVFDRDSGSAEVRQYGERLGMRAFAPFFEARKGAAKAPELRNLYSELRTTFKTLPDASTKEKMAEALLQFESSHQADCELLSSQDQFYGWSGGKGMLESYVQ